MADIVDRAQHAEAQHIDHALRARPVTDSGRASLLQCESCGDDIPEARGLAIQGCRLCVSCQEQMERMSRR